MNFDKLGLGTVQFGLHYGVSNIDGRTSENEAFKILDYAFDKNINLLDTAGDYGCSHEIIGSYQMNSLKKFNIVTKFKNISNIDQLKFVVDKYLTELNATSLYGLLFHSFYDFIQDSSIIHFLFEEILKKSKVKKIGVSIYSIEELKKVIENEYVNLIQIPYNLLDCSTEKLELIEKANKKGVEIHVRSIYLQGLFFLNPIQLPLKLRSLREPLIQLNYLSKKYNVSIRNMALMFVLNNDFINRVIIGVNNLEQLKQNIDLKIDTDLSFELFREISKINVENRYLLNPSNW